MAKAALMVEETEELEELEVPTGGIGDFVMEDDEAEKVYGDDSEVDAEDAKEEFGDRWHSTISCACRAYGQVWP